MTSPHSDRRVRRWAKRHQVPVPKSGRVPGVVREAFEKWMRLEALKNVKR